MPLRHGESGGISSSRPSNGGRRAKAPEYSELEGARGRDAFIEWPAGERFAGSELAVRGSWLGAVEAAG